ncbi:MAG: beta-L-arabinofuranosidase domain-containing protein [Flavisolibacter sp.]
MKQVFLLISASIATAVGFSQQQLQFHPLRTGSVLPAGWIQKQMQKDLAGFAGNLDSLVPDLFSDDIYGRDRLSKKSHAKNLGNSKEGDATGAEQYQWWNSETQSNWWDGYIRSVFMLHDSAGIKKVKQYIKHILSTQDKDGYLGIYDSTYRYHFASENGELWSKATLYRGLLAYYELTDDRTVLDAVIKAVSNVMRNYPVGQSSPFASGNGYNGGVSHGLMFTDVLYRLFLYTGQQSYVDYAFFLYNDYSKTAQFEKDAQAANIRNEDYRPLSHGVHTYEHLRSLATASLSAGGKEARQLLPLYLAKLNKLVTVTGGAIGDEWIGGRVADETNTGYEYCSLQELMDGYAMMLQLTGEAAYGDAVENIFYNAAQGSRHPGKSCIAYLKTDNSFLMDGTRNGEIEKGRKQTRYKYSPAHQDVAVCCSPNAGRITSYFVQNSWLKRDEHTLVFALLGPSVVKTTIEGTDVTIQVKTNYPFENSFTILAGSAQTVKLNLVIRRPGWANAVTSNASFKQNAGWMNFPITLKDRKTITLKLSASVLERTTSHGEKYFSYGALVYALPIAAEEKVGRDYGRGLTDLFYTPKQNEFYKFIATAKPGFKKDTITTTLLNTKTNEKENVLLIPLGKTILRQVTFPVK